ARAAALALALFFAHGLAFGFAVVVAVALRLARGHWRRQARHVVHLLPAAAAAATWLALRRQEAHAHAVGEWFSHERAIGLFSAPFAPFPDRRWALVAAAGLLLFLLVARGRLVLRPARLIPVGAALLAY